MKRIQITLCLILFGLLSFGQSLDELSFGTDSTFDVLTWNIEWFPKNGQTTIDYVAQIIKALDVDVLAIQEVDDISSFKELTGGLSAYEGYLESSYFAGLAYIYKKASIQINDIYEIYTTSAYWSPFPRSPMVMDLSYGNERFILINNHFKCCGDGDMEISDQDDEETRRYIASNLLKKYIDDNFPSENVIVLGDLNDVLTDAVENNVFQQIIDDNENYFFADSEIASGNESQWSYPTWPSHIDHICITNELFDELEKSGSAVQTIKLEEYISGGWSTYDEDISDHRPVAMRLRMNQNPNGTEAVKAAPGFFNYPNPFDTETVFSMDVSEGNREIEIINILGQSVYSARLAEGESSFVWNAEGLPDGVYIARLLVRNKVCASVKLLLRK